MGECVPGKEALDALDRLEALAHGPHGSVVRYPEQVEDAATVRSALSALREEAEQLREERDMARDQRNTWQEVALADEQRDEAAEAEVQRLREERRYERTGRQAAESELRHVRAKLERAEEGLRDAQAVITEQHGKLWLVGLDQHEGEEPQSEEDSIRNLRALLAASSRPPGDTEGRMLISVNYPNNPTDIIGKSAICPDCGNALLIATVREAKPEGGEA